MSERDEDLDKLLAPLRDLAPSLNQIQSWRVVVRDQWRDRPWLARLTSLAAAACIGFLIGAVTFKNKSVTTEENFDGRATIESVYSKSP